MISRVLIGLFALCSFTALHAEAIPDYYAEPGISSVRLQSSDTANESIDPFSGTLHLTHTDANVSGNGGLDISVVRAYTNYNPLGGLTGRTVAGMGWTMHFGRVLSGTSSGCGSDPFTLLDNPVIEMPDGSRHIIALNLAGDNGITQDRWDAGCAKNPDGSFNYDMFIVYAPDGTRYEMAETSVLNGDKVWHTTEIRDRNDNTISISYKEIGGAYSKYKVVDTVTSSDGRILIYSYINQNTDYAKLDSITSNGQTWQYKYTDAGIANYHYLTEVIRPDGLKWTYEYDTDNSFANPGLYSLKKVTYPNGGTLNYTYQYVAYDSIGSGPTTSILTKEKKGLDIENGIWSYTFTPSAPGQPLDTTLVTAPNGYTVYKHHGYGGAAPGTLWMIGLLAEKSTYTPLDVLVEKESYTWSGAQVISYEKYKRPTRFKNVSFIDPNYIAPILTQKTVQRDGTDYITSYSAHDVYGNPGVIIETGNNGTKTTRLDYFYNTDKWIIKQVANETIDGIGSVLRNFDTNGNVIAESKYGVVTNYTYHPSGDVKTVQNARGYVSTSSNYKRGTAQLESLPENVTISRIVNDTGTLASKTNGRGITTSFTYDSMNRLTGIDYPINTDVSIVYNGLSSTSLTRGTLKLVTTYDSFGRKIKTTQSDTLTGMSISIGDKYNTVGQKVFSSFPVYGESIAAAEGVTTAYDILDRPVSTTNPDLSKTQYTYLSGNRTRIRDARGNETTYTYRSYGDPTSQMVMQIASPEAVTTSIERNTLDLITMVTQGTLSRVYTYDAKYFLASRDDPEVGLNTFTYDAIGNLVTESVGGLSVADYTYDGLNRLRGKTYGISGVQLTTGDNVYRYTSYVEYSYNANNSITEIKSVDKDNDAANAGLTTYNARRKYVYDAKDNLISEELVLETDRNGFLYPKSYLTQYVYDNLDYLSQINYPKGTSVSYSPDALGRSSTVLPFVTSVDYHASGTPSQLVFANGQISQTQIDTRLRPIRYQSFGNSNNVDLSYTYDDVGNITGISDALDPQYSRSMSYDGLNRLVTANGQWGTGTISYDAVGNIVSKSIGAVNLGYSYDASNKLTQVTGTKPYTFSYDFRGNVESTGSQSFFYDFSNRVRKVHTGTISRYDYDGNGQRVRVRKDAEQTEYFYANNGNLLGEYQGLTFKEYAYLGSQLVAVRDVSIIPPVSQAGPDQYVYEGDSVTLNGNASHDDDGIIASYSWVQTSGPAVALSNATAVNPTFTAPAVASDMVAVFKLTVTDDDTYSTSDTVEIHIFDTSPPPAITGLSLTQGGGQNTLQWVNETKAQTYNVYWATSPGVTKTTGTKITNVIQPYVHSGLLNGTAYYYVITGVGTYGESDVSDEVVSVPGVNGVSTPLITHEIEGYYRKNYSVIEFPDGSRVAYYRVYDENTYKNKLYSTTYTPGTGWSSPTVDNTFDFYGYESIQFSGNSAGSIMAVYRKEHFLFARHKPAGQDWGAEVVISNNQDVFGERPVGYDVALSDNGSAIASWVEFCCGTFGRKYIKTTHFNPVSRTWATPESHFSATGDITVNVKTGGSGEAVIVWKAYVDSLYSKFYNSTTSTWGEVLSLSSSAGRYDFDMSAAGQALIAWGSGGSVHMRSHTPGFGWITTNSFEISGSVVPSVKTDSHGNGLVIWSDDGDGQLYSRRYDNTSGWDAEPQYAGYGKSFDLAIEFDDDGNAYALWKDVAHSYESLWVNRLSVATGWANQIRVTQVPVTGSYPIADFSLSTMNSGGALVSWVNESSAGANSAEHYSSEYIFFSEGAGQQNPSPIAIIEDRVNANEGANVILDASKSFDVDGTIEGYEWVQTSGTPVSLVNANTVNANFTAPLVNNYDELVFRLKLTDNNGGTTLAIQKVTLRDLPAPKFATILSHGTGNILTWEPQPGADSYNLYWGIVPGVSKETGTLIQNVSSPYTHSGLTVGQDYYYVLVAVNADGESGVSKEYRSNWKDGWQTPQVIENSSFSPTVYNLSVSGSGEAMVVWEHYISNVPRSEIFSNRFVPGKGWGTPTRIDTAQGSSTAPAVVTHPDGSSVSIWQYDDGEGGDLYAAAYDPASGWSMPTLISDGASGEYLSDYQLSIDSVGNVLVSWERANNIYSRPYSKASGWGPEFNIGQGFKPRLSMAPGGNAALVWLDPNVTNALGGGYNLALSRYTPAIGWSVPEIVTENINYLSEGAGIVLSDTSDLTVTWDKQTDDFNQIRTLFSRHYDDAGGWSAIAKVSFGEFRTITPRLVGDNTGNITVSWLKQVNTVDQRLMSRHYNPVFGWGDISRIDVEAGNVEAASLTTDANGEYLLVWRKVDPANAAYKAVYASRLSPQGWSTPEKISEAYQSNVLNAPMVGVDTHGESVVVWSQVGQFGSNDLNMSHYRISTSPPLNAVPVANAGTDQSVANNAVVVLDGSASTDSDGTLSSYQWLQLAGPVVTLDITDPVRPTFTAPAVTRDTALFFQLTVTDDGGEISHDTVTVTVANPLFNNTVPPVVTAPPGITIEATGATTAVLASVLGSGGAVDDLEGPLPVTHNAPASFPLGSTTVTWSATDSAGNVGTATQIVNVVDTTPPVVIAPADLNVEINPANPQTINLGAASVSDLFSPVSVTTDAPASFTLGTTVVTWTGTDTNGNSSSDTQSVTISLADTQSPVVTAPAAITVEATAINTPIAAATLGTATATDNKDGTVTPGSDAPASFPLGATMVTWSATDAAGNVGTATQVVTVVDTTPPSITAPVDLTIIVDPANPSPISLGSATVGDIFSPVAVITDAPASFPLGTTVVTWTGTDTNGNSSSDTQNVTLQLIGSQIPTVTAPLAITLEATGVTTPVSAATLGTASATDVNGNPLSVSNDAPASFPLGVTVVTWTATDANGNVGSAQQSVTLTDTTPPVLSVPADMSVESAVALAVNIGTASASDIFTPVSISNNAPALFPLGSTTVVWTAIDANGVSASANQQVTVTAPAAPNVAPSIANISAAFISGTQIQLAATASDPDNGPSPLSYQWTIISGGGSLTGASSSTAVYTLPSSNVTVTFNLLVSDGALNVQTNYTLTIGSGSSGGNEPPYATGYNAYYISSNEIQLSITAADPDSGPSPLSYAWSILSGGGGLTNASTANPVYTTTSLSAGTHTIYFEAVVSDGEVSVPYTLPLTITVY